MRHIPEAELHAYLDQALSRSQCVEIERHLAQCLRCQAQRDGIAALRDRTTELLARVGPPPIVPPAFTSLQARAAQVERHRSRWIAAGVWAASITGALLFGRELRRLPLAPADAPVARAVDSPAIRRDAPEVTSVAAVPQPIVKQGPVQPVRRPAPRPQLVRASRPAGSEAPAAIGFASAVETDPESYLPADGSSEMASSVPLDFNDPVVQPVGDDRGLRGLWRTIVPENDPGTEAGNIPLVPGLPVTQMRVQPGNGSSDVTAVDQLLESGEVIRTIAGPATRVLALVDEDARADSFVVERTAQSSDRMTVTLRQGDRMVAVTGPSQALGSLLARVNLRTGKRRY